MDDPMSKDIRNTKGTEEPANSDMRSIFALTAGLFAGLVWVGTKLADKTYIEVQPIYVDVTVKAEYVHEFIAATRESRDASLGERACLRYDIYQSNSDSTKFVLHEIYLVGGEAAHRATSHYAKWRSEVAPLMACNRARLKAMPSGYRLLA